MKRNQVIYPARKDVDPSEADNIIVGWIGNEAIYRASSVKTLKSKEAWFQQGLVLSEESCEPAKWVSDNRKNKKESSSNEAHLGQLPLYGEWQLKKYEPETATDGIIPKNEFGNVYLFQPWMKPINTVHITNELLTLKYQLDPSVLPLQSVAKAISIDYGEAVVGFDFSRGGARPRINGIIISQDLEDTFIQAYRQLSHEKIEKNLVENKLKIEKTWKNWIQKASILYDFERKFQN